MHLLSLLFTLFFFTELLWEHLCSFLFLLFYLRKILFFFLFQLLNLLVEFLLHLRFLRLLIELGLDKTLTLGWLNVCDPLLELRFLWFLHLFNLWNLALELHLILFIYRNLLSKWLFALFLEHFLFLLSILNFLGVISLHLCDLMIQFFDFRFILFFLMLKECFLFFQWFSLFAEILGLLFALTLEHLSLFGFFNKCFHIIHMHYFHLLKFSFLFFHLCKFLLLLCFEFLICFVALGFNLSYVLLELVLHLFLGNFDRFLCLLTRFQLAQ